MAIKNAIEEVKGVAHEVGDKVSKWMPWNWGKTELPVRSTRPPQRSPNPTDLVTLRDELEGLRRLISDSFPGFGRPALFGGSGPISDLLSTSWPVVDLEEEDDRYVVKADLPGVDESDLDVSIDEHTLTIRGEKKEHRESNRRGVHRVESYCGSFHRSIPLPAAVNPDAAKANYQRGQLVVKLPKADPSVVTRRRITVE